LCDGKVERKTAVEIKSTETDCIFFLSVGGYRCADKCTIFTCSCGIFEDIEHYMANEVAGQDS
jgi:hypothetical protein